MSFRKRKPWGQSKPAAASLVDWGHPFSQGLESFWIMNSQGGGRLFDSTGRHPGTLVSTAWAVGGLGRTLSFNGTSSYVNCGSFPSLVTPTRMSIVFSIYRRSGSGGIINYRNAGTGHGWALAYDASGNLEFYTGSAFVVSSTAIPIGVSVQGAFTYNAGSLKFYLNGGASISTASGATTNTGEGFVALGAWDVGATAPPDANIDYMRVYTSRLLTPTEISTLYTRPFLGVAEASRRIISQVATGIPFSARAPYITGLGSVTGLGSITF